MRYTKAKYIKEIKEEAMPLTECPLCCVDSVTMAVVTCDAISRGQCGLVSAIRHDTSHTVHPHPGHCSNTNTSARTCPLSHDSLACLCHDFVLQRTSDPRQVTCVDLCPI